jgi:4-hydroxy-tetrahydrodipicolinate reductase
MNIFVLGRGKTGALVAEVARERGHQVRVIGAEENRNAAALTPAALASVDALIDFTTPAAVVSNLPACLSAGARVVVGTTGWYEKLQEMRTLCERNNGALLYGANFSLGVQWTYRLAEEMARLLQGYAISVSETHHAGKKDAPSGTALSLKQALLAANPALATQTPPLEITSHRTGDSMGVHVVTARGTDDVIELRHEALSRRGFAEGAVRAAEWLAGRRGCFDFREIYSQLPH